MDDKIVFNVKNQLKIDTEPSNGGDNIDQAMNKLVGNIQTIVDSANDLSGRVSGLKGEIGEILNVEFNELAKKSDIPVITGGTNIEVVSGADERTKTINLKVDVATGHKDGFLSSYDKVHLDEWVSEKESLISYKNDNLAGEAMELAESVQESLGNKVDKVIGKKLSTEDFTTEEKSKLARLESSKFKGEYPSLVALQLAYPLAEAGAYARVDGGVGKSVVSYLWDSTDEDWVMQLGEATVETPASIKEKYESNEDTNVFTNAEKNKLANLENFSLPVASVETLGGVRVGYGLSIGTGGEIALDENVISANSNQESGTVGQDHLLVLKTTGTGSAYIVEDSRIKAPIETGFTFVLVPHIQSTNTICTLTVNGLSGVLKTQNTNATLGHLKSAWYLSANIPHIVTKINDGWLLRTMPPQVDGNDLTGVVPVNRGGTGLSYLSPGLVLTGNGMNGVSTLGVDTYPVSGSYNLITSGAVVEYIEKKIWEILGG